MPILHAPTRTAALEGLHEQDPRHAPGDSLLPEHLGLFRLTDFETTLIGTERFVEAVQRLVRDGADCQEFPVR